MQTNRRNLVVAGCVVSLLALLPLVIELGGNIMNLFIMFFIFVILSQSWNLMGGYAGQINLGLAAFFGCGVLVTHFLWKAEIPICLAVSAGGGAAVLLAGIIGLPTLRLKGMYFAIGTFALAEVCRIVVGNVFDRLVQMPGSYAAAFSLVPRYYLGLAVATIAVATVYVVTRSRLGIGMVALRDDETAAQVTGVNTFRCKVSALFMSAVLAGLAGGVYAYVRLSFTYMNVVFSPIWTFEPLMAAVIGGAGTILGPILGSIFLVGLTELFALTLGQAHLIIFGLLFILVVMYFRHGLVGSADQLRRTAISILRACSKITKTA